MKKQVHEMPPPDPAPQARDIPGTPQTVWEQLNKYGTYNIQPTQDRDFEFPAIEQHGLDRRD